MSNPIYFLHSWQRFHRWNYLKFLRCYLSNSFAVKIDWLSCCIIIEQEERSFPAFFFQITPDRVVRIFHSRHAIGPHARTDGGRRETRKGLRAAFSAQFDMHRCIVRTVRDRPSLPALHPVNGNLKAAWLALTLGEIRRVVFCFSPLTPACAAMVRDAIVCA